MKTILYIEDDLTISQAVKEFLQSKAYHVLHVSNGKEALSLLTTHSFDLVLLDLMLPDMNGEVVARYVSNDIKIPVIITSAKVTEDEVVAGFEAGARDYLKKPFGLRELLARIEVLVPNKTLSFNQNELLINPSTRTIMFNHNSVKMTHHEYDLLLTMITNRGQIFSREQLIITTFGHQYDGYERTIDSHIKNIRSKIEGDTKHPKYIETIRGIGYRFIGKLD